MPIHTTYYNRFRGWGTGNRPDGIIVNVQRSANFILSPSWKLLNDWQNRKKTGITWNEFKERLLVEINTPEAQSEIKRLAKLAINNDVWLICSCYNKRNECHRFILKELIEGQAKE